MGLGRKHGGASASLKADVEALWWYHTIDLPGQVTTPGFYDLRRLARQIPMPASLAGMRCLDVGTADGFWAFEMERRGADEVVALDGRNDLDWPVGVTPREHSSAATFELVHRALGSKVKHVTARVYDAPVALEGTFDYVFMGTILLHLRQPIDALAAVREVCSGQLLSLDIISLRLSLLHRVRPVAYTAVSDAPTWFLANREAHRAWIRAAGWHAIAANRRPLRMPSGPSAREFVPTTKVTSREERINRVKLRWGLPTDWVAAVPDPALAPGGAHEPETVQADGIPAVGVGDDLSEGDSHGRSLR